MIRFTDNPLEGLMQQKPLPGKPLSEQETVAWDTQNEGKPLKGDAYVGNNSAHN